MYRLHCKFLFVKLLLLLLPALVLLEVVIYPFTFNSIELSAQTRRATNLKLQTFAIPNEFSISYPAGWFVNHSSNPDAIPRELVIITSLKPPRIGGDEFPDDLIKTDIQINPGSFEENLSQINDSEPRDDGSKITRKGRTVVGGREAYRVWISDAEVNAIVTIISYKQDETMYIVSFYNHQNPAAIPIIQRVHGSFRTQQ